MPLQSIEKSIEQSIDVPMKNEPVLIRRFGLNQQALHAQEYLRKEGVEAFIFMDATWSSKGESQQGIRLVVKPSDANTAFSLLHDYDVEEEKSIALDAGKDTAKFYLQAAWLVSILLAFLLGSFLTDKTLEASEVAIGLIFISAASYFFYAANREKNKMPA